MADEVSKPRFDSYILKARVQPALLTVLPVPFAVAAWVPGLFESWNGLWSLITLAGAYGLLDQFGRDAGKRQEPFLFAIWGGIPTTRMLRHRHTKLDAVTLGRYHERLSKLTGENAPTVEEEQADPKTADEVYASFTRYLRENTRDNALVFSENCSYGFRRNLWGRKKLGGWLAVLGLAICLLALVRESPSPGVAIATAAANAVLVLGWFFVTPAWVRIPADAYALQLLSACDTLSAPSDD